MQKFGSVWTTQKLDAIENYLSAYAQIMKNQRFKICYIDAFAGSGSIILKGGQEIDGSAIRALKYPFNAFRFYEKDSEHFYALSLKIAEYHWIKDIKAVNKDCVDELMKIDEFNWKANHWRGVIFLDPYAMHLPWECLERISKTQVFDVWYLFPFSAVNRNLYNDGRIPEENKEVLNKILGSNNWETEIYTESAQQNLFGTTTEKADVEGVKNYILKRLGETFPTVSPKPVLLRNEKNSPIFLLCFAGSNPSPKARATSLKVANHILSHM